MAPVMPPALISAFTSPRFMQLNTLPSVSPSVSLSETSSNRLLSSSLWSAAPASVSPILFSWLLMACTSWIKAWVWLPVLVFRLLTPSMMEARLPFRLLRAAVMESRSLSVILGTVRSMLLSIWPSPPWSMVTSPSASPPPSPPKSRSTSKVGSLRRGRPCASPSRSSSLCSAGWSSGWSGSGAGAAVGSGSGGAVGASVTAGACVTAGVSVGSGVSSGSSVGSGVGTSSMVPLMLPLPDPSALPLPLPLIVPCPVSLVRSVMLMVWVPISNPLTVLSIRVSTASRALSTRPVRSFSWLVSSLEEAEASLVALFIRAERVSSSPCNSCKVSWLYCSTLEGSIWPTMPPPSLRALTVP